MQTSDMFPRLLQPITIKNLKLKNRMVAAPMGSLMASPEGYVTDRVKEIHSLRAWGGFGLVIVEATAVRNDGPIGGLMLCIENEKSLGGFAELVEIIHGASTRAGIQLVHGGGATNPDWINGRQPPTPSGITRHRLRPNQAHPREVSAGEIEELLDCWAKAADRAKRAGFDAIQLHMAHGTLMHQFMIPTLNVRSDKWGDPAAFAVEAVKRVRQAVGDNLPLMARISADDFSGDETIQVERQRIAVLLEEAGTDVIDVSAGQAGQAPSMYDGWTSQPVYRPRGCIVYLAEAIKRLVKMPVITVGRLNDPRLCEQIIAEGKADMVAFGRVAWADPEFAKKTAEGRGEDIRKCTACDLCASEATFGLPARCSVNYEIGRMPWEYEIRTVEQPKRVMIVGGGVGGMEAARVASLRKHNVVLYERDEELGGAMANMSSQIPHLNTRDLRNGVRWLIHELNKLGVKVKLNQEVTVELVDKEKPDIVILATGSLPLIPEIPGIGNKKVIILDDYLKKKADVGKEVVVLGGGYGAEIAVSLAREGKRVTLVEGGRRVAQTPFLHPRLTILRQYLAEEKVHILMQTKTKEIIDEGVVVVDKEGKETLSRADTVIIALARLPNNKLVQELKGTVGELYEIGDCYEPGNMLDSIHGASRLARRI